MTSTEKQIWIQVYSWHMASYEKRVADSGYGPATGPAMERQSEYAMEEACRAVTAFRKTLKPRSRWLSDAEAEMLDALDQTNIDTPCVDCKRQCKGCEKDA